METLENAQESKMATNDARAPGTPAAENRRPRVRPHVVTVGDCLFITPERRIGAPNSEGGVGFVLRVHEEWSFDLRYSVSNRVEERVRPARIESFNPLVTLAWSQTVFSSERLYLLSNAYPRPRDPPGLPARLLFSSASFSPILTPRSKEFKGQIQFDLNFCQPMIARTPRPVSGDSSLKTPLLFCGNQDKEPNPLLSEYVHTALSRRAQ